MVFALVGFIWWQPPDHHCSESIWGCLWTWGYSPQGFSMNLSAALGQGRCSFPPVNLGLCESQHSECCPHFRGLMVEFVSSQSPAEVQGKALHPQPPGCTEGTSEPSACSLVGDSPVATPQGCSRSPLCAHPCSRFPPSTARQWCDPMGRAPLLPLSGMVCRWMRKLDVSTGMHEGHRVLLLKQCIQICCDTFIC